MPSREPPGRRRREFAAEEAGRRRFFRRPENVSSGSLRCLAARLPPPGAVLGRGGFRPDLSWLSRWLRVNCSGTSHSSSATAGSSSGCQSLDSVRANGMVTWGVSP